MPAPDKIVELCDRFERNIDTYKQGKYNETQVRKEFIDPFFKILGWDMDNEQGYAEAYKDVVHEDAIKVGGATKAPDYSFRIGGARKFFLEAKKPSIYIKEDIHPAFQLRRYAWSAKLPLSVLTDFEEFAVYDCRIKPEKNDKASTARILYFTYKDYDSRWDEIAGIFTREAILKGSFDKYVESNKAKKGTAEVDQAFLQEIERWRDLLAKNIALRNPQLTQRDLNFAVQRTIDRIIFLRICEDRGIEPYGTLMALQNGAQVYPRLFQLFYRADERYNSGLFHFEPEKDRSEESLDALTPNLDIDDKVLKDIFKNLYYPDSPYEFYVLPADILGQVYEQFLGKVIRLTAGHRAVVETRPEVRKAGGVYYTPTYIVDYIVKQTVGRLLEDKMPGPKGTASKLRILDPACGSGSFLLGAYQFLLNWHRDAYLKDNPEAWAKKKNPPLRQNASGEWVLTTDERKRILLNNIYGVDIDPQAVEVTKLSLLLKVLEGADANTLEQQMKFFHERALPDLSQNIKCGNSLIGPDFYDGQQLGLLDDEEMHRINAFDWKKEFAEVFENGGFDAVIGNPPYGAELQLDERNYLNKKFNAGTTDTAALMMLNSLNFLNKNCRNGFIVPKPFIFSSNWEYIRNIFIEGLIELIDVGKVWKEVKLEQIIYIYQKESKNLEYISMKRDYINFEFLATILKENCKRFNFYLNGINQGELEIGLKIIKLGESFGKFVTNTRGGMFQKLITDQENDFKVLGGKQINSYRITGVKGYLDNTDELQTNAFLKPNSILAQNIVAHIQNPIDHIKIIATIIPNEEIKNFVILDTVNQLTNNSDYSDFYFLGILSSKLMNWYVYRFIFAKAIRTMHFDKPVTDRIPIRALNLSSKIDKSHHDQMVQLVERMLDLHKQLAAAQNPQTRTVLQRQIEATDRQVDQLVYALYELTAEEIGIVEGGK
ncbi:N-6 DNA methylase [candidate division KSB1 bacterium]|nr:N-6 DNA methylase [candidate division KSB1 bacterium]